MDHNKKLTEELLALADVKVNGNRPWDIQVHDELFYSRVLKDRSLCLGESYMDGWWDCERVDEFFYRIVMADLESKIKADIKTLSKLLAGTILNLQPKRRAFEIGERHYDIGNDLFEKMLDNRMVYSCGYWKNAKNLDEAQEAKLDLVCKKAGLKQGMKVLDIGCGWGSFAKYAAEKYDVEVVGITVSKEQVEYTISPLSFKHFLASAKISLCNLAQNGDGTACFKGRGQSIQAGVNALSIENAQREESFPNWQRRQEHS
jgi:cyclopropane-fatty-acyl-phospholipid synthase